MNSDRYNKLAPFWFRKFGGRVEKLCIDGGFDCPNRDGSRGLGGCIFCEQPPRNEHINEDAIQKQVKIAIEESKPCKAFVAYFQSYSGTYAPIGTLRQKYDAALIDNRILALAVATRPDCINEEVVALLKEYTDRYYVYVEMGLQTSSDITAKTINRAYPTQDFSTATRLLTENGIDVVAHLIFGLPKENDEDIANTIRYINTQRVSGVKIHSLFVTKNTGLYSLYQNNLYTPLSFDQYIAKLTYAITHLREDIVIHRITGDCPRGKLIAPAWNNHKKLVRNALELALQNNNLRQGIFYSPNEEK